MIPFRNLAVSGLLLCAQGAAASSLPVIDDFTGGKATIVVNGAKQTGDSVTTVFGKGRHILGGTRQTSFEVPKQGNPFALNAELAISPATSAAPAALTISSGFGMAVRADLVWGNSVNNPLNVDLSPYNRFRLHFLALDGDQDAVMQTFSAGGNGEWGCSLAASPYHAVTVDMPFANAAGADLTAVTEVALVSQGGAYGYDTAISLIEVLPASDTSVADVTCPAITSSARR